MAFPEEKEAWEQEKKKKGGYDMELINKDALKKDILALPNCYNGFSDTFDKACIIGVIDEQPTIEERKWIPWDSGRRRFFRKAFCNRPYRSGRLRACSF